MVGQVSGVDGRLPIWSRCGRVYDKFHSFKRVSSFLRQLSVCVTDGFEVAGERSLRPHKYTSINQSDQARFLPLVALSHIEGPPPLVVLKEPVARGEGSSIAVVIACVFFWVMRVTGYADGSDSHISCKSARLCGPGVQHA